MTKKHFIAIAAVIADQMKTTHGADGLAQRDILDATAAALADVFAGLNGQFDRDRFLRACGSKGK